MVMNEPMPRRHDEAEARAHAKMARRFERFFREFHALAKKHHMEAALTCVTSVDAQTGEVHMSSDASTVRLEDGRECGEGAVGDLREAMQVALDDLMMALELKWSAQDAAFEPEPECTCGCAHEPEFKREFEPEHPPARLPPPATPRPGSMMDPIARLKALGLPLDVPPMPVSLVTAPLSFEHTPYAFQQFVPRSKYRIN
jgi:hypothetical protein